jgi:hypothetical protein
VFSVVKGLDFVSGKGSQSRETAENQTPQNEYSRAQDGVLHSQDLTRDSGQSESKFAETAKNPHGH